MPLLESQSKGLSSGFVMAPISSQSATQSLPVGLLGDYYRILPAGKYEVLVHAEGYEPAARNVRSVLQYRNRDINGFGVQVTVTNTVRDSAMVVDFTLKPLIAEQPTDEEIAQLVEALEQQQQE
ncbi:hypothetical protein ANCDUO_00636 [Ancylostoma duodenale]|uniref:PEGA domain-containing protein n=1 Tax=Ancylostoma duodenale TaxID=51022 RepID=A0A0C2HHB6_9BILA|nr:hypothetical protein ANCDUO_00636 [Ancylostoma duodenale]